MKYKSLWKIPVIITIIAIVSTQIGFSTEIVSGKMDVDRVEDVLGRTQGEIAPPLGSGGRLQPDFPPPVVTNKLDLLLIIMTDIDADYEDENGDPQHETSSMYQLDIITIENQFQRFVDTVYYYSGGWLELDYDEIIIDEPITEISGNGGSGYHVNANDMAWSYQDQIDFGQYDSVMLYWKPTQIPTGGIWGLAWWYYQGSTPEGEAWGGEIQPSQGAAYINCFYYSGLGNQHWELNLHEWLHHLNSLMYYKAGFPNEMVPDSHYQDDPDWDPQGHSSMDYYVHILTDHMTPLLYASAEVIDRSDAPYYRDWLVLGPFDNTDDSGLEEDFIGEETILPEEGMESGGFTWETLESGTDFIDLKSHFSTSEDKVAYLHTYVHSAGTRAARIWTGSNDGLKVWLNGDLVRDTHVHRKERADAEEKTVLFREGWNRLLIKVENATGSKWGAYARVFGLRGGIIDDFITRLNPPPPSYSEGGQYP